MRKPKWTTVRWRIPGRLRRERFVQLLGNRDLREILNADFIEQLDKRKNLLEGRQFKLLSIQAPIFFFLAFSLLNLDIHVTLFGLSTDASRGLREVLLVLSTALGLFAMGINFELRFIKEMLKGFITRVSKNRPDLPEFLEVRYGLSSILSPFKSYDDDLLIGAWQWFFAALFGLIVIVMVALVVVSGFFVQFTILIEVYRHPNYSHEISLFVITFVALGDILTVLAWFLFSSVQPYQTYEDFRALVRLERKDEVKYKQVLKDMVQKHYSKGLLSRVFGRPRLRPFK